MISIGLLEVGAYMSNGATTGEDTSIWKMENLLQFRTNTFYFEKYYDNEIFILILDFFQYITAWNLM